MQKPKDNVDFITPNLRRGMSDYLRELKEKEAVLIVEGKLRGCPADGEAVDDDYCTSSGFGTGCKHWKDGRCTL